MNLLRLLVLALLVMPGILKAAQNQIKNDKVSDVVTTSFSEKCPEMDVKKWKKEDGKFVAVFFKGDKTFEASFDADGNWLQTADRIKWEDLPSAVRKTFYASDYRWLNHNWAEKRQTKKYKEVYVIEGDNLNEESGPLRNFRVWLTADGKIVKQQSGF